jgi:3-oxoisoapionate decarboxylase
MTTRRSSQPPRVGIDNYGLSSLGLTLLGTLEWAHRHGAQGVAFSGLRPEDDARLDTAEIDRLATFAREHDLYLEWGGAQHVPRDLVTWKTKDILAVNRRAAERAARLGARVVRSCSGGLMRWHDEAPPTETLLREAAAALREQRSLWRDHGATLAIETHFEFTSHELLRLFDMCEAEPGGWLGICLDTMNLLVMLEDPVSATARLLPYVVSTHVKDGGLLIDAAGMTAFPAPIGGGVIDLGVVVRLLASLDRPVHLSVEDHAGSFALPVFDPLFVSKFPDLDVGTFARLVALSQKTAARAEARPVPREEWPGMAERRMAGDIARLIDLARRAATDQA